jgi:hypothetical protein
MNMSKEYSDLLDILVEVRASVPDSRFIWCIAADDFETSVSHRRGLILGGAWSPHFLRDKETLWSDVPWTARLWNPRIVTVEKAVTPLAHWLPLMEAIAKAGESLLLVTREISTELLRTWIVNSTREALSCCVVRVAENPSGYGLPVARIPWEFVEDPPKTANLLPQAAEAWSRRTATVLFPMSDNDWWSAVSDVTIISVGGENYDDQQDRLRFLVETIQRPMDGFT